MFIEDCVENWSDEGFIQAVKVDKIEGLDAVFWRDQRKRKD